MTVVYPASTNYCTNPSFELDANSDGSSDGLTYAGGGTDVVSRVAGRTGGYAQRVVVSSGTGSGGTTYFHLEGAAGSFAPGETATVSVWLKGTFTGCSPKLFLYARTSANGDAGSVNSGADIPVTIGDWTRYSLTYPTLPATTDHMAVQLQVLNIHEGDAADYTVDDVLIEESAVLTPYFDGDTHNCSWSGAAHASTSLRPEGWPVGGAGVWPVLDDALWQVTCGSDAQGWRDITDECGGLVYSNVRPGGAASCSFTIPGDVAALGYNELRPDMRLKVVYAGEVAWDGFILPRGVNYQGE